MNLLTPPRHRYDRKNEDRFVFTVLNSLPEENEKKMRKCSQRTSVVTKTYTDPKWQTIYERPRVSYNNTLVLTITLSLRMPNVHNFQRIMNIIFQEKNNN